MNKKITATTRNKGVPVIQDNGYGGCLYIGEGSSSVELVQQDMVLNTNTPYTYDIMQCSLSGSIQNGLEMLVSANNVAPGVAMLGELRIYKRHSPIDPDDPMLFMIYDENGVPKKDAQGRYEWSYVDYVEAEGE